MNLSTINTQINYTPCARAPPCPTIFPPLISLRAASSTGAHSDFREVGDRIPSVSAGSMLTGFFMSNLAPRYTLYTMKNMDTEEAEELASYIGTL